MKLLEKILVATDFSQSAGDAVQTARTLAGAFGSEIIFIHVIPGVSDSRVNLRTSRKPGSVAKTQSGAGQRRAFEQAVRSSRWVGIRPDHPGASELLDVNVIVVGSGDRAEEGACPLGVTAERLVRKASKPVWVVKAGAAPVFKRILCTADFSDPSRRALVRH